MERAAKEGEAVYRLDARNRMIEGCHVRFCESARVRFPRATGLIKTALLSAYLPIKIILKIKIVKSILRINGIVTEKS